MSEERIVPCTGCFLCTISVLILIGGGIMYGVCRDADINGKCGGNIEIAESGYIMMIVGGSLVAFDIVLLICCFCIMGIMTLN